MISTKRLFYLFLICVTFISFNVFFCLYNKLSLDKVILLSALGLIFFIVFCICIIRKRLSGNIYPGTNYKKLFFIFLFSFIALFVSTLFLDLYFPYSLISVLLVSALPAELAMGVNMYFLLLISVIYPINNNSFYAYIIISVITILICQVLKENNFRFKFSLAFVELFSVFFISLLFSYFTDYFVEIMEVMILALNGVFSAIFILILYNILLNSFKTELFTSIEKLVNEKYPLLEDLKHFSPVEYNYAIKLSVLSAKCASLINADADVARCGALYYRGANMEKNGSKHSYIKKLNNNCFPPEVIRIVSEWGTKNLHPSTKESAIVFMADTIMSKFEAIFKKADKSTWNLTMVVYQTLNEQSGAGIYDKCGLSMNEFLIIRDYLAKNELF